MTDAMKPCHAVFKVRYWETLLLSFIKKYPGFPQKSY